MKSKILLLLFSVVLLTTSCQVEEVVINNPENEGAIAARSALAGLVIQTTMNDGSQDNIIDNSSCLTVQLPVTVVANGIVVNVNTHDDFIKIERIFDELPDDIDNLIINFPITVTLADFSEVIVNSEDELEDLKEDCIEGGDDLDIECIDFVYPITISYYDSVSQVIDVVTLGSDEDLFQYFNSLDESEFVSIEFPITVVVSDSIEIQINNNIELEEAIETYADQCDEDDDNDYSDDDIDDTELVSVLTGGDWAVDEFLDETDITSHYLGYIFSFNEDRSAYARKGEQQINGSWETYGDNGMLEFEMDFEMDYPLDKLSEEWNVFDFNDSTIYLQDFDEVGLNSFLTLRKSNASDTTANNYVSDIIIDSEWLITLYSESDTIKTDLFSGFTMQFSTDSTVVVTNGVDNINGTWQEIVDFETHLFEFVFEEITPFDRLNEEWFVMSYIETRVELRKENSESTAFDVLVMEKVQ